MEQTGEINMPIVWSVAGSDSCAGAGIQADLKTFQSYDVFACNIITSVTAQNTSCVTNIAAVSQEVFKDQLVCLEAEFMPKAIKSGLLVSPEQAEILGHFLEDHPEVFYLCDPVMISTSNHKLCDDKTIAAIKNKLLSRVNLLTPNHKEAEYLSNLKISSVVDMFKAAKIILAKYNCESILIKGGDLQNDSEINTICDVYLNLNGKYLFLETEKLGYDGQKFHGTGCTLSAAIVALMALGSSIDNALVTSKNYICQSIKESKINGRSSSILAFNKQSFMGCLPSINTLSRIESIQCEDNNIREYKFHTYIINDYFDPMNTDFRFYPIVDSSAWVERLAKLKVNTLQLRLKGLSHNHLEAEISKAIAIAKKYKIALFINDHWQLALKYKAYGVHLGQEDLANTDLLAIQNAGLRLGLSTHDYYELAIALQIKPSYIALGPIYHTQTKKMRFSPQGIEKIRQWKVLIKDIPLVAIGGIKLEHMEKIYQAGANSIAVISYITKASLVEQNLQAALNM